jgi:hypothetical protein
MKKMEWNQNSKAQQKNTYNKLLSYQKQVERQIGRRKDKQRMIRRG